MKIRVSDKELALQGKQGSECRFLIASGMPEAESMGSVGTDWPQKLRRAGFPVDPLAWDFAIIAGSVVCADQAVSRRASPDGWTRVIDLTVDVLAPQVWQAAAHELERALGYLTGDRWSLKFVRGLATRPAGASPKRLDHDCVSLLSGGLDSLIGGIDLKAQGRRPFFVSQTARGDSGKQLEFASRISGDALSHFQFGENVHLPKGMRADTSHRSRSILFLAMGALAACGTKKYAELKSKQRVQLVVPENGFISVNVPLTPTRLGSHSTKTTHPYFMAKIQAVFDAVGMKVELLNPYQWTTKAEMIKGCRDRKQLDKLIFSSTSCGRFARTYTHCGRCVPCIIRRTAIRQCYAKDKTINGYLFDDLGKDDRNHALFSDVLAVKLALSSVARFGIDGWAGSSISSVLIPDVDACRSMLDRSMVELGRFFKRFA